MVKAVFAGSCPNCGGPISSTRLELGLPCSSCLPDIEEVEAKRLSSLPPEDRFKEISRKIPVEKEGSYSVLAELHEELSRFERFFVKCVGKRLWSLQKTWAYRMLSGDSFAITAPTGVGKTTLLLVYSIYEASEGTRVLVLVPTETLLRQSLERLKAYSSVAKESVRVLGYMSKASKKEREEALAKINGGDFDILVITTSFLSRHFEILKNKVFGLIVVDDADSLLKDSANVDRILVLSGFKENDISAAMKLIKLRNELYFLKLANRNSDRVEQLEKELEELEVIIAKARGEGSRGQLLIASATGRQSGIRPKLFKEFLGFEIGGIHAYMRNVIDSFELCTDKGEMRKKLLEVVKALGGGGIVFVSKDEGTLEAKEITSYLTAHGIKAELAIAGKKSIEKMRKGEVDILVGVASYYGVAVRGLDLPEIIRYAVFVGAPKNRAPLEQSLLNPRRLLHVLAYLSERDLHLKNMLPELNRKLSKLTPSELNALRISLMKGTINNLSDWMRNIAESLLQGVAEVERVLKSLLKVGESLSAGTLVITRKSDEEFYVLSPDPLTYIQASGRTSRFLNDKMTLGLSVILELDIKNIEAFRRKMNIFSRNFELKKLSELNLKEISNLLDSSRRGERGVKSFRPAKSLLMIVESPNKARTIAWYFGRPSRRKFGKIVAYEVPIIDDETLDTYLVTIVATKGHMYDLITDEGIGLHGVILSGDEFIPVYTPISKCYSCGRTFSNLEGVCPYCGERLKIGRSTEILQALRKLSLESEEVVIATDPDIEGEKIAWDVYLMLKPFSKRISRAEFHEVTPDAIVKSLRNLREVNSARVAAQIVRRITDRWIGFPLSTLLKEKYGKPWLGAGRVQIPVLGWSINRYVEWKRDAGYFVKVKGDNGIEITYFRKKREDAEALANAIMKQGYLEVHSFKKKTEEFNPAPPYTTDSLLFDASKRLKLGATYAMKLLQDLFEAGLITYHRTDSTHISNKGIQVAKEYFDKVIRRPDLFFPRAWGKEGAHEAIRPTKPIDAEELKRQILDGSVKVPLNFSPRHFELYDMIFRRFIAGQARPSLVEKAVLKLKSPEGDIAEKEIVLREVQDGALSVGEAEFNLNAESIAASGKVIVRKEMIAIYRSSLTPLHSEGSLIKLMKEREIGRPSTYAKTIDSLKRHGYVIISSKRGFVVPTKTGIEIHEFLTTNYTDLVTEEATRDLEKKMDAIESGRDAYEKVTSELYEKLRTLGLLSKSVLNTNAQGFLGEALT